MAVVSNRARALRAVAALVVTAALGLVGGCTATPSSSSSASALERYISSVSVSAAAAENDVRVVAGQLGFGPTEGPSFGLAETASIVNGGSIQHTLSASRAFRTIRFAVEDLAPEGGEAHESTGLPDFGYYEIELSAPVTEATIVLTVPQSLPGDRFVMYFRTADAAGRGGPVVSQAINVVPVGTGDVQVSVSWDVDSDLDLHVVEPSGEVIYYSHTDSSSGGTLDLDSNAGCAIDGVRNENITWDTGDAPAGEYRVVVNLYSPCTTVATNYVVTVTVGGSTQTFSGRADGSGNQGEGGEGDLITTFQVAGID